jgi:integrase
VNLPVASRLRARSELHPAILAKNGEALPRRMQTDQLFGVVPYGLRHTAASAMIAAGVPVAEIARRLGHSGDVLLKVYAGFFDSDAERGNTNLDHYFREHLHTA